MKKQIDEIKRMQELAGIYEVKITKPLQIHINPTSNNNGDVNINGYDVPYTVSKEYVSLKICDSWDFLNSIDSPLINMGDEDGNVDREMSKESERVCELYLQGIKRFFGPAVTIKEDNYGIYYYLIPKDQFYKRLLLDNKIKQIDNNTFEYKNKILKIKELSSAELTKYIDEYMDDYYRLYPHMENSKHGTRENIINIYFQNKPYYFIMDDKGKYYVNPFNNVLKNKPLPVSHSIIFSELNLGLKPIFDAMYGTTYK